MSVWGKILVCAVKSNAIESFFRVELKYGFIYEHKTKCSWN